MAKDFKLHEESNLSPARKNKTNAGIIGLVIKSGIVKTEGQANALLIVFVVIGLCAIVYLNLQTFSS